MWDNPALRYEEDNFTPGAIMQYTFKLCARVAEPAPALAPQCFGATGFFPQFGCLKTC